MAVLGLYYVHSCLPLQLIDSGAQAQLVVAQGLTAPQYVESLFPEITHVSPALVGGCLATGPLGCPNP